MFVPVQFAVTRSARRLRSDISLGRGFTLLELIAVIGLIALLAGLILGGGQHAMASARSARARAELEVLSAALQAYRQEHGDYPRTNDATQLLQALIGKRGPDNEPRASRSLVDVARFDVAAGADPVADQAAMLLDPWGQPYRYAYRSQAPWTNPLCVLWSSGPDRQSAGDLLTGGYADRNAAGNGDNLYAGLP